MGNSVAWKEEEEEEEERKEEVEHKWIDKSKTTFHHWSRKFLTRNFHQAFPLQTPSALLVNKIGFLKMINSVIKVWDFIFVT